MAGSKGKYMTLRNALRRAAKEASDEVIASEQGNADGKPVVRKARFAPEPCTIGTEIYRALIESGGRGITQDFYENMIPDVVVFDEIALKPEKFVVLDESDGRL